MHHWKSVSNIPCLALNHSFMVIRAVVCTSEKKFKNERYITSSKLQNINMTYQKKTTLEFKYIKCI